MTRKIIVGALGLSACLATADPEAPMESATDTTSDGADTSTATGTGLVCDEDKAADCLTSVDEILVACQAGCVSTPANDCDLQRCFAYCDQSHASGEVECMESNGCDSSLAHCESDCAGETAVCLFQIKSTCAPSELATCLDGYPACLSDCSS